jgi:hypothetical protein
METSRAQLPCGQVPNRLGIKQCIQLVFIYAQFHRTFDCTRFPLPDIRPAREIFRHDCTEKLYSLLTAAFTCKRVWGGPHKDMCAPSYSMVAESSLLPTKDQPRYKRSSVTVTIKLEPMLAAATKGTGSVSQSNVTELTGMPISRKTPAMSRTEAGSVTARI